MGYLCENITGFKYRLYTRIMSTYNVEQFFNASQPKHTSYWGAVVLQADYGHTKNTCISCYTKVTCVFLVCITIVSLQCGASEPHEEG